MGRWAKCCRGVRAPPSVPRCERTLSEKGLYSSANSRAPFAADHVLSVSPPRVTAVGWTALCRVRAPFCGTYRQDHSTVREGGLSLFVRPYTPFFSERRLFFSAFLSHVPYYTVVRYYSSTLDVQSCRSGLGWWAFIVCGAKFILRYGNRVCRSGPLTQYGLGYSTNLAHICVCCVRRAVCVVCCVLCVCVCVYRRLRKLRRLRKSEQNPLRFGSRNVDC